MTFNVYELQVDTKENTSRPLLTGCVMMRDMIKECNQTEKWLRTTLEQQ